MAPVELLEQALTDSLLQWRQWSYYKLKYQEFEG